MKSGTPSLRPSEEDTPMMQQYHRIKRECADAILFFRMGDFYEMFHDDAKEASPILEIALTSRSKNKSQPIPMCGVPYHSANVYISKLIKAGKKVAICEQTEDPKQTKGLVKREIVRVVTPGTVIDDALLDPKENHFIVSLYGGRDGLGLAALDVSTGLFKVTEIRGGDAALADELEKLDPKEVLTPETLPDESVLPRHWAHNGGPFRHTLEDWKFSHGEARGKLLEHFKTHSLEGFGCEALVYAVCAAGALIRYLEETQKSTLQHIHSIAPFHIDDHMLLDPTTIQSLELVRSSEGSRKHSLLDLLDGSKTPLGARRIKEWILKPLVKREDIESRLDKVGAFKENVLLRNDLRDLLARVHDLERLTGRIALAVCSARDLVALKNSIATFPKIRELLQAAPAPAVQAITQDWDDLADLFKLIDTNIADEPPLNFKEGNVLKPGCDPELDRLRAIRKDGKQWITALEAKEKERTGIPALKVGYNKIYGFYLEVTKKHQDKIPKEYIRKQSLVNAERFVSPELKEQEAEILEAEERMIAREQSLFQEIRARIADEGARVQHMARILGETDALLAFAETAHRHNYCRPVTGGDTELVLTNSRHPLVERLAPAGQFIANDVHLDTQDRQILILTGPNMAGKSTYLRQVALITLMAQIGCFVPAESAHIGLVDRIFSRVGAQDHLLKGESTFMVEMNETANILNNATSSSLIILDEIGRGTSTFDGISIAWSIVEYLHRDNRGQGGPKTLFATHYHELTELALVLEGVKNANVQVKEWNEEIIFLRKIAPGGADKSYGIQVARLAGLPDRVIRRAVEVLDNLEKNEFDALGLPKISHSEIPSVPPDQMTLFGQETHPVLNRLKSVKPDELTPRQALDLVYELAALEKENRSA